MIKGTFWLEEKPDGGVSIGIEDYEVEMFGGGDYEWIYTLDRENRKKMEEILSKTYSGTFEEMIEEEFGIHLDKKILRFWLKDNGIEFEFYSWLT